MKIIASRKVLEGSQINVLHKEANTWILISKEEFDESIKYDEDNLSIIEEEYLYSRIPKLRGKLSEPNGTTINIDYRSGEINVNPKHFHFGIPTHGAKAVRQVNAGFNLLHFLKITKSQFKTTLIPVSYTHLTLPTICSV